MQNLSTKYLQTRYRCIYKDQTSSNWLHPEIQRWLYVGRPGDVINHTNGLKDKAHPTISMDAKNACDKIQYKSPSK